MIAFGILLFLTAVFLVTWFVYARSQERIDITPEEAIASLSENGFVIISQEYRDNESYSNIIGSPLYGYLLTTSYQGNELIINLIYYNNWSETRTVAFQWIKTCKMWQRSTSSIICGENFTYGRLFISFATDSIISDKTIRKDILNIIKTTQD